MYNVAPRCVALLHRVCCTAAWRVLLQLSGLHALYDDLALSGGLAVEREVFDVATSQVSNGRSDHSQ